MSDLSSFALMVPGATPAAELAQIESPFDRTVIGTVEQGDAAVARRALDTAASLFADRDGWLSPADRMDILNRTAVLMSERRQSLALEAAREGGKPLADSLVETDRAIEGVQLCVETLRTQAGVEIPMNLNPASAGGLGAN